MVITRGPRVFSFSTTTLSCLTFNTCALADNPYGRFSSSATRWARRTGSSLCRNWAESRSCGVRVGVGGQGASSSLVPPSLPRAYISPPPNPHTHLALNRPRPKVQHVLQRDARLLAQRAREDVVDHRLGHRVHQPHRLRAGRQGGGWGHEGAQDGGGGPAGGHCGLCFGGGGAQLSARGLCFLVPRGARGDTRGPGARAEREHAVPPVSKVDAGGQLWRGGAREGGGRSK